MFQYHCLNPIAGVGLANFNENYQQTESLEGADAVLVRSAAMHGMELLIPVKIQVFHRQHIQMSHQY